MHEKKKIFPCHFSFQVLWLQNSENWQRGALISSASPFAQHFPSAFPQDWHRKQAGFTSCTSSIIKYANIWVGKDCRAHSNRSQTLYNQIPTLRIVWVPHPPHFSTYSSFPDWLWPRCSLHTQLRVITLHKPLSQAFPTPLCHSILHFPQRLQIPLGSWAGTAEFCAKMQLLMRRIPCLDGPRTTRDSSPHPPPKWSFSLNCCFLLQAEGPWDYKTFKSFFLCPVTMVSLFWGWSCFV